MQPQNPDPKFDFMLKNQPQAKRPLGLPTLSKPVKIGLGVGGGIIILIFLGSLLSGGGNAATTAINGVLARGTETLRVTKEVQQLTLQDPANQNLASNVTASLTSDQVQLKNYLVNLKAVPTDLELAADLDKSTDTQMQTASQNNDLDQTYITYLQQVLAKYRTDIQTAYAAAGPNGKAILKSSLDGVNALLSTAPLKS